MLGAKRHMNDIAATLGIAGLHNYNRMMKHRSDLFDIYREELSKVDGIKLLDCKGNTYWLATVLVERRDDFAKKLFERGIECNIVQTRNDVYSIFGKKKANLPVMNSVEDKYISIPIGPHITIEDVKYISSVIKEGW
jgi:dTDP-4-amino-4,6-dideoxygalactose transaminase